MGENRGITAGEDVQTYIEANLAPRLQGDGGWVEFQGMDGDILQMVFRGECSKCLILDRCCHWMEEKIYQGLGERVRIQAIRRKPFFWDNQ